MNQAKRVLPGGLLGRTERNEFFYIYTSEAAQHTLSCKCYVLTPLLVAQATAVQAKGPLVFEQFPAVPLEADCPASWERASTDKPLGMAEPRR